jgi:hypothetical protein
MFLIVIVIPFTENAKRKRYKDTRTAGKKDYSVEALT